MTAEPPVRVNFGWLSLFGVMPPLCRGANLFGLMELAGWQFNPSQMPTE